MQVVRSGLWTQRSVSIGLGSVSMGALRERLNDERWAREWVQMHTSNHKSFRNAFASRGSLAENPGYTPACPATAAGHTIIMMAAISSCQVFQPAARADRLALSSYRFVVREPQRG